jgi:hypothetical protein
MSSTSSREQSVLPSRVHHHLILNDQSTEKEELRSCEPYHRAQKAWIWN